MLQKRVITTALDVVLCDKSGESHCIELTATPLFDANNVDLIGGGDKFVLIMNDCVNRESINAFTLNVVEAIRPPLDILGGQFRLTVSMGISIFP